MTEPKPESQYHIRERDVQGACVAFLRCSGWFVLITSQDKGMRRQVSGLPDLLAFKQGHTLLIECKAPGKNLRQSQIDFRNRILPHTSQHLKFWVIDGIDRLVNAVRTHFPLI